MIDIVKLKLDRCRHLTPLPLTPLPLSGISYLGAFGGGQNIITFGMDFLIMGLFTLVIFNLALTSSKTSVKAFQNQVQLNLAFTIKNNE